MNINQINELVENINEAYNEFIEKNRGERYAIARLFEEFDTYNNGDLVEDIVTNMAIGEIVIEQDSVFIGNLQCIKKSLQKYENIKEELKNEITEQELVEITVSVNKVLNMLDKMSIDSNSLIMLEGWDNIGWFIICYTYKWKIVYKIILTAGAGSGSIAEVGMKESVGQTNIPIKVKGLEDIGILRNIGGW